MHASTTKSNSLIGAHRSNARQVHRSIAGLRTCSPHPTVGIALDCARRCSLPGDPRPPRATVDAHESLAALHSAERLTLSVPLVMFRWFVWCDGDSVVDGRCGEEARKRLQLPPAAALSKAEPSLGVRAIAWSECESVLREKMQSD